VRENETHSMKDVFVNAYEWLSETGSIMVNSMESKLIALAFAREGFRNVPANLSVSKIDSEVKLTTVKGVLSYLPRAAQIAFLSPFPQHWFGTGSLEANTMMRRIAAFEMLGVYFCLIFLPYAIWFWRQKAEVWLVLIYCVPPLLMQGVVVANIGTLYRLRYGFLMALVALGLAGFLTLIQRIKTRVTGGL
ncbi:MAG: hypothetical protein OEV28_05260, partial [Nitrospirota bacterium]|nr:hypothetical protein [Nitrospirota bacterium]